MVFINQCNIVMQNIVILQCEDLFFFLTLNAFPVILTHKLLRKKEVTYVSVLHEYKQIRERKHLTAD